MDAKLKKVQSTNGVPDFGDERIRYAQLENDQLIYVDRLPVYARAIGQELPLSEEALYSCYLLSLEEIKRQAELLSLFKYTPT